MNFMTNENNLGKKNQHFRRRPHLQKCVHTHTIADDRPTQWAQWEFCLPIVRNNGGPAPITKTVNRFVSSRQPHLPLVKTSNDHPWSIDKKNSHPCRVLNYRYVCNRFIFSLVFNLIVRILLIFDVFSLCQLSLSRQNVS